MRGVDFRSLSDGVDLKSAQAARSSPSTTAIALRKMLPSALSNTSAYDDADHQSSKVT